MKFERYARYQPITITQRKIAAFARKQQNERARYPLFADHVASEQRTIETEMTRRSGAWESIEVSMRAHHAKTWRTSRARYFSLPEAIQQQIRVKWNSWVGPRTPSYFAWVVDSLSGDQAKRVERCDRERRDIIARIPKSAYAATASLF
jgi:hypothetical protein